MSQVVVQFDLKTPLFGSRTIQFRGYFPLEVSDFGFSHSLGRLQPITLLKLCKFYDCFLANSGRSLQLIAKGGFRPDY